jgi:hypothetical protein
MAFTTLLAIQAVVDEKESSKAIWFEIMIKKGSNGFGICFIEDPYRRQVSNSSSLLQRNKTLSILCI